MKPTLLDIYIFLLNFPNNPTGYSINSSEGGKIVEIIETTAKKGTQTIVILDDAYFGLFYEDEIMQESLFGHLINRQKNILGIKLDGPTKELFVWGFRVGFLTYGLGEGDEEI